MTASTMDPYDLEVAAQQQLLAAPSVLPFDDEDTPVLVLEVAAHVMSIELLADRRLVPTATYSDEAAAAALWRTSAPGRTIGHAVAEAMIYLLADGYVAIAAEWTCQDHDQDQDDAPASVHLLRTEHAGPGDGATPDDVDQQ